MTYNIGKLQNSIRVFKESLSKEQFETLRDRNFVIQSRLGRGKRIKSSTKDDHANMHYQYRDWRQIYMLNKLVQDEISPEGESNKAKTSPYLRTQQVK